MNRRTPVRRVVTGHDENGKSVVLTDGDAPHSWESETVHGLGATVAWWTPAETIRHWSTTDVASSDAQIPTFPGPGQTIVRIADFPPDSAYPTDAATTVFDDIDGHSARDAGVSQGDSRHFWFHRTDSLDYAVVIEGEIVMLLDEGEVTLRPGDVIVQRATNHSWSNKTEQNARVMFVLLGTEPQTPAEIATELRGRANLTHRAR